MIARAERAARHLMRKRGRLALWIYVGLASLFLALPLLLIVPMSFTSSSFLIFPPPDWSFRWYRSYVESSDWIASTIDSIQIAMGAMLFSTIIGAMAAFPLVRRDFRGKFLMLIVVSSPLIVPEIAIAIGLYFVLLPLGFTDQLVPVVLGTSVLTLPFATLIVAASLRGFDRTLEDAARSLGANSSRVLWHITLPGIRPAIVTAMAFTFIFALNDLLMPLYLAGVELVPLPIRIWSGIRRSLDLTTLSITVLWLIVSVVALLLVDLQRRRSLRRSRRNEQPVGVATAGSTEAVA